MPSPSPTAVSDVVQVAVSNHDYLLLAAVAVAGIWCVVGCLIAIALW